MKGLFPLCWSASNIKTKYPDVNTPDSPMWLAPPAGLEWNRYLAPVEDPGFLQQSLKQGMYGNTLQSFTSSSLNSTDVCDQVVTSYSSDSVEPCSPISLPSTTSTKEFEADYYAPESPGVPGEYQRPMSQQDTHRPFSRQEIHRPSSTMAFHPVVEKTYSFSPPQPVVVDFFEDEEYDQENQGDTQYQQQNQIYHQSQRDSKMKRYYNKYVKRSDYWG